MTIVVDSLGWTPVKATVLHWAPALALTEAGLPDDRLFLFVEADGRQSNTGPGMLVIESAWDPATRRLALILPDGRRAEGVVPLPDPGPVDPEHPHQIIDGPFAELLSEHLGRPMRLAMSRRTIGAVDVEPVTLLSLESIAAVEGFLGGCALGAERFRMSINLAGALPFEEDTWYGRRLAIGSAILRVTGPVARCAVTTYAPRTGVRDASTVRALVQRRTAIPNPDSAEHEPVQAPLGVYARVEVPGRVACGQPVTLLDAAPAELQR